MRRTRLLLIFTFLLASIGGSLLLGRSVSVAGRADDRNYWRHHDGRWSHWDSRDKRWYYTDGSHWYYHTGKAWAPYRFDRTFGKDFERGTYVVPAEGATVVVPNHGVYVPR